MIAEKSRADWFGASDVNYIVGNYDTKSFQKWWLEKIGLRRNDFTNAAMMAGTHFEHKILDFLNVPEKDKQIKMPKLRLRVNLDGNSDDTIFEVKTYRLDKGFKLPLKYKRQVWVQLLAAKYQKAVLEAYGLTDYDYKNYFNPIEGERLQEFEISPNDEWIEDVFLPHIEYLVECYKKGVLPTNDGFQSQNR